MAVLALSLITASCATFDQGATDSVYILSDPPGAKVTVNFENETCTTPCQFDVDRHVEFTVFVAKEGYDTASVEVKTHSTAPDSATSKDVTPDYLGRVIDYRNGANIVHVPNPVNVTLKKTAG